MSDATHLAQRQALKDLNTMARADLEAVWPTLAKGSATELRDGLADVLPALGNGYGNAAAQLGAVYYEDLRDLSGATRPFEPVLPDLPDEGRWGSLANWSTLEIRGRERALWEARLEDQFLGKANPALGKDPGEAARWAVAMEKVYGGLQRSIADQHRMTVVQSSLADPAAQGWSRVGVGGSCEFCTMLIGRGAVYSDTTVTFRTHDHCNCSAAPAFSNLLAPPKTFATGLSPEGTNTFAAQAASVPDPPKPPKPWKPSDADVDRDNIKWPYKGRRPYEDSTGGTERRTGIDNVVRPVRSQEVNDALASYIDYDWATEVNDALRGYEEMTEEMQERVDLLDAGMNMRVTGKKSVYRGMSMYGDDMEKYRTPGTIIQDGGFLSTGSSESIATDYLDMFDVGEDGWLMEIQLDSSARFNVGMYDPEGGPFEVLLSRKTQLEVVDVDEVSRRVKMRAIGPSKQKK